VFTFIKSTWPERQRDVQAQITASDGDHLDLPGGQAVSSYVLGLPLAFCWTPCIGPILGAILTVSAASATFADGVALLTI